MYIFIEPIVSEMKCYRKSKDKLYNINQKTIKIITKDTTYQPATKYNHKTICTLGNIKERHEVIKQ